MSSPDRPKTPRYLDQADAFYKAAFDIQDSDELARAMADWGQLSDAERSFTLAHLLYLNLQGQAQNGRLLRETRDTLDEIADELSDALDEALADGDEDEPTDDADTEQPSGQAAPPAPEA